MEFLPFNNRIIVKPVRKASDEVGGLFMPDDNSKFLKFGEVVRVDPLENVFEPGMKIYYNSMTEVKLDGDENQTIIPRTEIVAYTKLEESDSFLDSHEGQDEKSKDSKQPDH